jgi:hypothetical protein
MTQLGLYNVQSPLANARAFMGQAANSYGAMQRKAERPDPTLGGGMMSAAGGALTAASIGSALGSTTAAGAAVGGPAGMAVGAGLGALSYFLS